MASNSFGNIFRYTTWGESHGQAIGVVIDGCPPGLTISEALINEALLHRAPGRSKYTSPRKESDTCELLSGVYNNISTGAPISIIIHNHDADSSKYEPIKDVLRPGHANYTYLEKYKIFDFRGGGRASARETASRVAAGAVAQAILDQYGIKVAAFISAIGEVSGSYPQHLPSAEAILASSIFVPDKELETRMINYLEHVKSLGDSSGGVVGFVISNLPPGIGDPIYEKLEANLAKAMLSIPASKGFEIGEGFRAATMLGSEHNDVFSGDKQAPTVTNFAGGLLAGISTGMPVYGKVAFKPTSSIKLKQSTVDVRGQPVEFTLPEGSRHDPCVAIRAVPVVSAMCKVVVADALLLSNIGAYN